MYYYRFGIKGFINNFLFLIVLSSPSPLLVAGPVKKLTIFASSLTYRLTRIQGYPTGTSTNDNARRLREVRFAAANIGDESISCSMPGAQSCGSCLKIKT